MMKHLVVLGIVVCLVTGCASKELMSQAYQTNPIFLNPVGTSDNDTRWVYVDVVNTTSQPMLDISEPIKAKLLARGFSITRHPWKAQRQLSIQIMKLEKTTPEKADKRVRSLSGALIGGATGYGIGRAFGDYKGGAVGAFLGLALGAGSVLIHDAVNNDVVYMVEGELQVTERVNGDVTAELLADNRQGSGEIRQYYKEETNIVKHRSPIISLAQKNNLELAEALPVLVDGLVNSATGTLGAIW